MHAKANMCVVVIVVVVVGYCYDQEELCVGLMMMLCPSFSLIGAGITQRERERESERYYMMSLQHLFFSLSSVLLSLHGISSDRRENAMSIHDYSGFLHCTTYLQALQSNLPCTFLINE